MTMNEGFFGQYSVFCVFGSVVGCVVVPLIAQVLQQQSMECVILSAIVISLTAAHLNKKGGNDPTYSKILISKEIERKKINHNNNSHKKQKNHVQQQYIHNTHQIQLEQDYMQQHEHLRNIEIERRSEEKRLKKLRKREERLKKREEENRKQKQLEEHYQNLKEKRLKQQKENYHKTSSRYLESAGQNFEKFGGCYNENKRTGLAPVDTNRITSAKPSRTFMNSNNSYYLQKIPRFERNRTGSCTSDSVKSLNTENNSTVSNNLTIKCNLSASCSSLSSISSCDSASPPMAVSIPCTKTPWVMPASTSDSLSVLPATTTKLCSDNDGAITSSHEMEKSVKSYSSNRVTKTRPKLIPNSSSLFCSHLDDLTGKEVGTESQQIVGEYSLFGPQPFITSFTRSPVL